MSKTDLKRKYLDATVPATRKEALRERHSLH